jgi:hypothetical protein
MALYPAPFVARLKARGIAWWAYVSTLAEARLLKLRARTLSWSRAWRRAATAAVLKPAVPTQEWSACSR